MCFGGGKNSCGVIKMKGKKDFPVTEEETEIAKHCAFFYRPINDAHEFGKMGIVYPDDEAVEEERRWLEEHQL